MRFSKLSVVVILFVASCQKNHNYKELKNELYEIMQADRKYRSYFSKINSDQAFKDSLAKAWDIDADSLSYGVWDRQLKNDSLNTIRVTQIIQKYGYPGISMVGEELSRVAWLVLQHAPLHIMQDQYSTLKKAVSESELHESRLAMFEDRMLMYQALPQKYGSQVQRIKLKSGEYLWIIWPIENPLEVNELQEKVGFGDSVEENANAMGIDFVPYSLNELNQIADSLPYPVHF